MARPRIIQLFSSERGIAEGPFNGYILLASIFMVALCLVIFFSGSAFYSNSLLQILIFGCMALGYDYFSGYTGYYNLGYGAFVGLGAYIFVFISDAGVLIPISIILAGLGTAIFALAISYPFLRLKGAYFAIATLALVLLLQIFDANLSSFTGGTAGIILSYSTNPLKTYLFFGSLFVLLVSMYFHTIIGKSRFGLALRSVREEEDVSESYGVNAFRIKQIAMVLSAFFGGISGGLFAIFLGFINVDNVFGLGVGLFPVVAAITGGSGIFLGPVVGSFILIIVRLGLPPFLAQISPTLTVGPLVVIGFVLLIVGLFIPGGVLRAGFLRKYSYIKADRKLTDGFGKKSMVDTKRTSVESSKTN